jgi:hypothetical protein
VASSCCQFAGRPERLLSVEVDWDGEEAADAETDAPAARAEETSAVAAKGSSQKQQRATASEFTAPQFLQIWINGLFCAADAIGPENPGERRRF